MNNFKIIFASLIACLLSSLSFAQPDNHHGCRHAHHKIQVAALTADQMAQMASDDARSDTIDIIDYTINLDIFDVNTSYINGNCEVTFSAKMNNVNSITLDLQNLNVDSILLNGNQVAYAYDNLKLHVNLPTMNIGDLEALVVYYNGSPDVDASAFGGLAFSNGYAYNLGIGLSSNPPNFGRSWFPCFDSFVERSTYEYNIRTTGNNRAFCVGSYIGQAQEGGDTIVRTYQMSQPIPTYLSSIAVSNYVSSNSTHNGLNGTIPVQLVARQANIAEMDDTFVDLGKAIDALEYWYGPYPWERVGYVATPVGAMEHPTNIAYPTTFSFAGNSSAHRRLMSHELAHCWFGNVATVGSPSDMWFKEGNAEYGSHLMTEHAFGYDAFIKQVKDNHLVDVLRNAHVNDEGFHPLSGMPFEWTYGVTTYNKGAAMIHNLRAYLGDELFRAGQQAVLSDFEYKSVNAAEYRDALMTATGKDLTNFFDDWIYQPGFSAFEINDYTVTPSGGNYSIEIELEQKLRGADHLYKDVPIEITIIDAQLNKHKDLAIINAQPTATITIMSPIEPAYITVNENNLLNMAHMSHQKTINPITGSVNMPHVDFDLTVQEIVEPTWIHIDHYWVAPDPIINNPENAIISPTHYWKVQGDFSNGFATKGVFEYDDLLDADMTAGTEEDMILLYRQDPNFDWQEYDNYTHLSFNLTDGTGFMRIDNLIPGEFTLAKGTLPLFTSNKEVIIKKHTLSVFPNPTTDEVTLQIELAHKIQELNLELIDISGKIVLGKNIPVSNFSVQQDINLKDLPNGMYWAVLKDENGVLQEATAIEKIAK